MKTKPAQVLLSEDDRQVQAEIKVRLIKLGVTAAIGPTLLHRLGIRALLSLKDGPLKSLVRSLNDTEESS